MNRWICLLPLKRGNRFTKVQPQDSFIRRFAHHVARHLHCALLEVAQRQCAKNAVTFKVCRSWRQYFDFKDNTWRQETHENPIHSEIFELKRPSAACFSLKVSQWKKNCMDKKCNLCKCIQCHVIKLFTPFHQWLCLIQNTLSKNVQLCNTQKFGMARFM